MSIRQLASNLVLAAAATLPLTADAREASRPELAPMPRALQKEPAAKPAAPAKQAPQGAPKQGPRFIDGVDDPRDILPPHMWKHYA